MASATPRATASTSLPAWAAVCFFASGAAGLLYEIVWSKQLAYVLGSSLHAVATVTAAFLCGLAIGARALGVPLASRGQGPRTYALLELGVAVLGVALLPLLRGVEPLFGQLYRQLGGESTGFAAARFVLSFVLLLPPTVLMGATLPVLVAAFERDLVGPALARLYALNTFGAVAGSALAGFVLLPGVGLSATTWVAAALNAGVAALAFAAGGGAAARPAPAGESLAAPAGLSPGRAVVAGLFALSGFAALAFQIAWVRLFGLVFGSSVYSFAGVLGIYLFGLALGSAIVSPFLPRVGTLAGFARLQLALAAVTALSLPGFAKLPDAMFDLAARSGDRWTALFTGQLGLVAMTVLLPCVLLGAIFPVATRLLQRGSGGDAAGFAYAVNTAGTIAGSLVAGFVLVPKLGVQGTHVAALAISAAIGVAALGLARVRGQGRGADLILAPVALAVAILAVRSAPAWDPSLMSSGVYRPKQASDMALAAQAEEATGSLLQRATRHERVLYYREGENGSVLVGSDADDRQRWLKVGGKIDASTNDMETQVLLGLLPAALADSGSRALVVGLGSGYTAAALLAAGAGPTDVVELERGVVEASEFFLPGEANPIRDPRVHLVMGDARTHLEHAAGTYGVIVSEPSNPWIAGVNNLFTVDFYRRVRSRLAPDGVFCQWMQLYELSPETMRSMLASFRAVFPEGNVFVMWRNVDLLLVAAPKDRALSLARLRSPAVRKLLDAARIAAPEDVGAYWAAPVAALEPLGHGATLNRDDRPVVEYRAPRDLVVVGHAALAGAPDARRLMPFEPALPAGPLFSAWSREDLCGRRARLLIALGERDRARTAIAGARAEGFGALADRLDAEVEAGARRKQADDLILEATNLIATRRLDEGRATLERAAQLDPTYSKVWLMVCDRRRIAGDLAGAEEALRHVRPGEDASIDGDAGVMHALLALARRDTAAAIAHFGEAQRAAPGNPRPFLFEAQLRAKRGDGPGARAALERGVATNPNDPALAQALGRFVR